MGLNVLLSRDSYPMDSRNRNLESFNEMVTNDSIEEALPNPKPDNYKILRSEQFGNILVVKINYPDCNNYEGNKILVYQDVTIDELLKQKLIDPHFSDNQNYYSPIARFEPTNKGWNLSVRFANNIKWEKH